MFESLSNKLESAFKNLRGQGRLTEENMKEGLEQIRLALLEADVNYNVAKKFIENVRENAVGQEVIKSVNPGQQIVKIVHDELVQLMGEKHEPLRRSNTPPTVIMMVGLQGQGKTTTCGKLAVQLKKKGHRPLVVGADVYRPAAIQQLETVAKQAEVECFSLGENANPVDTCLMAKGEASLRQCDTVILDTAGRMHVDDKMMGEVRQIAAQVKPDEILFVANAQTGQDAVNSAKEFNDNLPLTGVVLTQMDGDARGGAALSLIEVTGCPVKFIGTGEKLDALEAFHPNRLADQVLGMGDIVSLVEKAQEVVDQEKALKFQKKARKGDFDLEDFLEQMQQVKKMGSMGDVMKMIPGMSKMMGEADLEAAQDELRVTESIIYSMTPLERRKPRLINGSRRRRIAQGCGRQVQDVNRMLKDFEKTKKGMKKMMKMMRGGKGPKGRGPGGPGALPPGMPRF